MATANQATSANPSAPKRRLEFYAHPGAMTAPGRYAARLDALPDDIAALAGIVQGLCIHEFMASAYAVTIPEDRKAESQIRSLDRMLDALLDEDPAPLAVARPPEKRLVSVCNHFAVLMVGALRAQGIPARARWGFGAYFNPPFFEDHVLGEYWDGSDGRWVRVDAQLDEVFRKTLKINFNPLDVPPDRFVTAGDAWGECRAGQSDPSKYGIFKGDLRGLWFIACSLVKDVAALNKMEMLPWDTWGGMPAPGTQLDEPQLRFYDRLAAVIRAPDDFFEELRRLYESDTRLRVPPTVFNSMLKRTDTI